MTRRNNMLNEKRNQPSERKVVGYAQTGGNIRGIEGVQDNTSGGNTRAPKTRQPPKNNNSGSNNK